MEEVRQAILAGEIIEDYPEDKYGHSCLICGRTEAGKILHIQCSVEPVWIITAYDPTLNVKECEACGEKVLSPRVSQALFEKLRKGDFVEATLTIPVLDGTYG
jgi:hypothetical protein